LERLSKRIQLTFESHFCEYDVCDFSVTFRFCSFLANFSRIWFYISSRLVLPIIDTVGLQMRRFILGYISIERMIEELRFKKPAIQYFFGTELAVGYLKKI
jgi:hypothetical protein